MPSVMRSPVPSKPLLTVLAEAVAWAELHGHPIRLRDLIGHGVVCVSGEARELWVRDRNQAGCSPVGAAILQHQPRCTLLPEAAALALGVSIPEAEGVGDGASRSPKSSGWAGLARHLYEHGFELGVLFYVALKSRTCAKHGRWPLDLERCPVCKEREAAELDRLAAREDA